MRAIYPSQRVWWDVFCSAAILATAFEIPYDWLVGWENPVVANAVNGAICAVFGADMVLNALTVRRRSYAGLWGWRHFAGLVSRRWAPEAVPERGRESGLIIEPRAIARSYLRSGWFVVDLVSTLPWGIFLRQARIVTNLRVLRLLRIARLLRFLRLTKALVVLERIRRVTPDIPSLERLFFTVLAIPWFAHIHACLFYFFESRAPGRTITYSKALHEVFISFSTNNEIRQALTPAGFWVGISAVIFSIFIIASVTGNLAALFTGFELSGRGRKAALRSGHAVILGWNSTIFDIIEQLSSRDEHRRPHDIVVLAPRPEADIWRELEESGASVGVGQLTVLEGQTSSVARIRDLGIAFASQVIVLRTPPAAWDDPAAANEAADVEVLKALLACSQALQEAAEVRSSLGCAPPQVAIVAAVHSRATARMFAQGIPNVLVHGRLQLVDVGDLMVRCLVQLAHQPGLAPVFDELFSYTVGSTGRRAAEVYVTPVEPAQVGVAFEDSLLAYPGAIPIGYRRGAADAGLVINPAPVSPDAAYRLRAGDSVVSIAHHRHAVAWQYNRELTPVSPAPGVELRPPRSVLVLGDGPKAQAVLALLPAFLPGGSRIVTNADLAGLDAVACTYHALLERPQPPGAPDTKPLWAAELQGVSCTEYDTALVVAEPRGRSTHDASILMSLTWLHAHLDDARSGPRAVLELLDARNAKLAATYGNTVALVSAKLVSNYLVQVASNPARGAVFQELLDPGGSEIYLRSAGVYLLPGESTATFELVMLRARTLSELAIGHVAADGTLVLCPTGEQRDASVIARDTTRIVVLAPGPAPLAPGIG